MSGRYQLFVADGEIFDHDHARAFGMGQQFRLTVHEVNVGWKDIRRLRAHVVAPAKKIRRVVLAEMRKGIQPLFRRARIQDDLNETEKAIVLYDELHSGMGLRRLLLPPHPNLPKGEGTKKALN